MENSTSLFHWIPRIIGLLAIIFITMFAFDAFTPGLSPQKQLADFVIHLIPSIVLIAVMVVAWKWEFIGGILFTTIGILLSPFVFMLNLNHNQSVPQSFGIILTTTIPFVVVGILFIVSDKIEKKNQTIH